LVLVLPALVAIVWLSGVVLTTDTKVAQRSAGGFKRVLVVFPHADDETVNCGGTINRLVAAGAEVILVLLTAGERGNPAGALDEHLKTVRRDEARRAAKILGVSQLIQADFGDGHVGERRPEIKDYLTDLVLSMQPDLVLGYDGAGLDGHPDHVACAEILMELKHAQIVSADLWCVALPARILRLLDLVGQLKHQPGLEQLRASPTLRVFIGLAVISKIRAWYTYRSQRGAIAKGLGRLIPIWFAVSMMQFEYFAEVA
jgi:LmbE family N-acetylglucosaminyl deacetylase